MYDAQVSVCIEEAKKLGPSDNKHQLNFANWNVKEKKAFQNNAQGRLQTHMLVSLLTKIEVSQAVHATACYST